MVFVYISQWPLFDCKFVGEVSVCFDGAVADWWCNL